jgi:hypothetical protein
MTIAAKCSPGDEDRMSATSAFGTFETCRQALRMSVYRVPGKPEVVDP